MSIIRKNYSDCYSDMVTRSMLAPIFPTLVATQAVSKDGLFIINNTLYKATADIAQDVQIVVGTNAELASTIAEEFYEKPSSDIDSQSAVVKGLAITYAKKGNVFSLSLAGPTTAAFSAAENVYTFPFYFNTSYFIGGKMATSGGNSYPFLLTNGSDGRGVLRCASAISSGNDMRFSFSGLCKDLGST